MGQAKQRLLNGESKEEEIFRKQNWEKQKYLQRATKKAHRFIRGRFNPLTGEIE